ncbi:MAG: arginine--tRNA ligase [Actinomycetota bacterium]
MITDDLTALVEGALDNLRSDGSIPPDSNVPVEISRPQRPEHGEFATNVAMALAGKAKTQPRKLAEMLAGALPASELVSQVDVAGPGFINFHLSPKWLTGVLIDIAERGRDFGRGAYRDQKIQIEFVSANPTGPLHVGSGRNAAYGDALARLLTAAGYEVSREYYINDAGKQMERFGASLHARYLQALGRTAEVPEDGYQGEYLADLGKQLAAEFGEELVDGQARIRALGTERMVDMHRRTLERFGVHFDRWTSETALHKAGKITDGIQRLIERGHTFEADGAVWFRSSELGAPRDQVIVRSSPEATPTYLGSDVGYLIDKIERGFDRVIYVWGADHHGNMAGLKAVAKALEIQQPVEVILHQMVNFVTPEGEAAKMSKRAGQIVTLDSLIDEVGTDAARFTLLSRTVDATIDFDLDLVSSQTQENPVYYVQYQHARACSILSNAAGEGIEPAEPDPTALDLLGHPSETALIRKLAELPELVVQSAELRAPHRLTHYAQALASDFSAFYRDCRVLTEDAELSGARLRLADCTRVVLADTLDLLGVSAPESM